MKAYFSKDLDIAELKSSAQKEWEERGHKAEPDLALLTQVDIHGNRSEQGLGRDTLVTTQGDLLKMTGETNLSEESRQLLLLSVSSFTREHSREGSFLFSIRAFSSTFPNIHLNFSFWVFTVSLRPSVGQSY